MKDKDIIQLYWNRDEKALSATQHKYGKYCTAIAMNILGNKEDAKECVNDAYLAVWDSIPPNRPAMLSPFLGKITRNLALNCYRKNHAKKRGKGELNLVLEELEELISSNTSVEQELDRLELVLTINDFLETLPTEKRNLFVCRYFYSDSISQIAKRYKMTDTNVSVSLCRIREKLKHYLTERGFDL